MEDCLRNCCYPDSCITIHYETTNTGYCGTNYTRINTRHLQICEIWGQLVRDRTLQVVVTQIPACLKLWNSGVHKSTKQKSIRQYVALTMSSMKTGWRVRIPENHSALSLEACCRIWVEEYVTVEQFLFRNFHSQKSKWSRWHTMNNTEAREI
jgi:hypothetical protein